MMIKNGSKPQHVGLCVHSSSWTYKDSSWYLKPMPRPAAHIQWHNRESMSSTDGIFTSSLFRSSNKKLLIRANPNLQTISSNKTKTTTKNQNDSCSANVWEQQEVQIDFQLQIKVYKNTTYCMSKQLNFYFCHFFSKSQTGRGMKKCEREVHTMI